MPDLNALIRLAQDAYKNYRAPRQPADYPGAPSMPTVQVQPYQYQPDVNRAPPDGQIQRPDSGMLGSGMANRAANALLLREYQQRAQEANDLGQPFPAFEDWLRTR